MTTQMNKIVASLLIACLAYQVSCYQDASNHLENADASELSSDQLEGVYKVIRDFWNSDTARAIRNKYEEYKERAFERFADAFKRRYDASELPKRMETFLARYSYIESWNRKYEQGQVSFSVGLNHLADLTGDELDNLHKLDVPANIYDETNSENGNEDNDLLIVNTNLTGLPVSKSWLDYFTPVRSQIDCGSCYAFATVDSITAQLAIAGRKTKPTKDYSVQQIVDCSTRDKGCQGGWPERTLEYIRSAGLARESDYPYKARRATCKVKRLSLLPVTRKMPFLRFKRLQGEASFKEHLATRGPVITAMTVVPESFAFYKKGLYEEPKCNGATINHAVILAGYGNEQGKDYWVIRNSHGSDWGERGHMKILRGKQMCQIGLIGWGLTRL